MRELEAPLRRGLADLALALDDRQVQQLLDYLALLAKWGRVYNLTARLEPDERLQMRNVHRTERAKGDANRAAV